MKRNILLLIAVAILIAATGCNKKKKLIDGAHQITSVYYSRGALEEGAPRLIVLKTDTGAIAKYLQQGVKEGDRKELKIELTTKEWLDFANELYKLRFDKWDERYDDENVFDGEYWVFNVSLSDNDTLSFFGVNAYPPNWEEFEKIMYSMEAKIKRVLAMELEAKLKTLYQEKFGTPISDFELYIDEIKIMVDIIVEEKPRYRTFEADRMPMGVFVRFYPDKLEVELTLDEWLDFVNALYKLRINEWKSTYGDPRNIKDMNTSTGYRMSISYSNKDELIFSNDFDEFYKKFHSAGFDSKYPPNWDEFMKVIDDLKAKIKEGGE